MAKSIRDRVGDSFSENDSDKVVKYMEWLTSAISDYKENIRRLSSIALLLAAVFGLVASSRNVELSIGSFHIIRGSVILVLLPAVINYLFLQIMWDTHRADQLQDAFTAALKIWSPKAEENDLDSLLAGPGPIYWNPIQAGTRAENMYEFDKLADSTAYIFLFIFMIGLLVFDGLAYWVVFPLHPVDFISWSISLGVTLICLTLSMLFLMADNLR
jgi:hypothetical protein